MRAVTSVAAPLTVLLTLLAVLCGAQPPPLAAAAHPVPPAATAHAHLPLSRDGAHPPYAHRAPAAAAPATVNSPAPPSGWTPPRPSRPAHPGPRTAPADAAPNAPPHYSPATPLTPTEQSVAPGSDAGAPHTVEARVGFPHARSALPHAEPVRRAGAGFGAEAHRYPQPYPHTGAVLPECGMPGPPLAGTAVAAGAGDRVCAARREGLPGVRAPPVNSVSR
ncbi:hypothetical protein [Streptomyces sp. NPDC058045]|uniref:hypothetical protein n=1 Tax=Streptomyces sp. NPDC058045 TaxID=3346311 RepID=UPI0036E9B857